MCTCSNLLIIVAALFLLCKFLDRLVRLPTTTKPTLLKDRILVTGCDSGFGNLLAKRLDGKGFHVFAACLTENGRADLEAVTSDRLRAFLMDVSTQQSVENGYKFVRENLLENGGNQHVTTPYIGLVQIILITGADFVIRCRYKRAPDSPAIGKHHHWSSVALYTAIFILWVYMYRPS